MKNVSQGMAMGMPQAAVLKGPAKKAVKTVKKAVKKVVAIKKAMKKK
jgi:hypothetical protein